jgi:hypothetical protein
MIRIVQRLRLYWRLFQLNRKISSRARPAEHKAPVIFFNASARLEGLNLNAAFQLLTSWSMQLAGRKVVHFACRSGMSRCVLGAGLGDPTAPPPCPGCISDTGWFTAAAPTVWFTYRENPDLKKQLASLSPSALAEIEYAGRPLGRLVLPSLRWILRRHHLQDDPVTRYLFREFILSAHNIAEKFQDLLDEVDPEAVVVFNGQQYPEAVVRWTAKQQQIRVITHEVNLQPFSAFFTEGQATIYPQNIPESFELSKQQDQKLDRYLQKRFQGEFTMAGIQFWSEMSRLPAPLLQKIDQFNEIVPAFTNVVFDTSQMHANTLFLDMFAWLDLLLETARDYPETLFVIRAHPDEIREGKKSAESVSAWAEKQQLDSRENLVFIAPEETLSSYELIGRAKFTLVYNSSIGLEAVILGCPVLCAGKARYTDYQTVFYPQSSAAYRSQLRSFLEKNTVELPEKHLENARKFLYFQLYRSSLPFDNYLMEHATPGYVQLKNFSWEQLHPENSPVLRTVVDGILTGKEFVLEQDP